MRTAIIIALGANLPLTELSGPRESCLWAVNAIGKVATLRLRRLSHLYRTAPVPASDQPDYVNAVAVYSGAGEPLDILHQLQAIEDLAGRVRTVRNASRVLDLDLLAVDDLTSDGPELILPHPRLHERGFVLFPLCDVAPDWRHPRLGETAALMRRRVADQAVERLRERAEGLPLAGRHIR